MQDSDTRVYNWKYIYITDKIENKTGKYCISEF